jgi:hypothetical protein
LAPHADWLLGLRWVSRLEQWPALLAAALSLGCAGAALWHGAWLGAAAALAHLALLAAAAALAPRRYCAALLGMVCIALVNYAVVLLVQPPQLALIELAHCGLGLAGLLAAAAALPRLRRAWAGVAKLAGRDDFRWLLTAAPLLLRWRVLAELQALNADGNAARPAGRD